MLGETVETRRPSARTCVLPRPTITDECGFIYPNPDMMFTARNAAEDQEIATGLPSASSLF